MFELQALIQRKVIILEADNTAYDAARAMRENAVGSVMVADHSQKMVGIVTDRDLVERVIADAGNLERPLRDVMSRDLKTVDELNTTENVVEIMETYGIRRVPVIRRLDSKGERCVGIISLDDLIASKSLNTVQLSRIVQAQIYRRQSHGFGKAELIYVREKGKEENSGFIRGFFVKMQMAFGIDFETSEEIARHLITALVRRLHCTGAMHLITQLPRGLREEFVDLAAGPDRSVTVELVLWELHEEFEMSDARAKEILAAFWSVIRDTGNAQELSHLEAQLPGDFARAFGINDYDTVAEAEKILSAQMDVM